MTSKGLQKEGKKDLSRILRAEAAIKGIERKANSKKHNNLMPKAVLEALDEAIREKRWEAALKVGGRFLVSYYLFLFQNFSWFDIFCVFLFLG